MIVESYIEWNHIAIIFKIQLNSMRHHLSRARQVYNTRGLRDMVITTLKYIPIELNNIFYQTKCGSGVNIMDQDWDNLIILDACRYDLFANHVTIDGKLESRISLGSTSDEFLEQNFGDKTFHNTVYINSNPYLPRLDLDHGTFHAVVDLLNEWDSELQTVHPETVTDATYEAHKKYPNKRIIAHYMQPHIPFIGETGRKISSKGWTLGQEASNIKEKTVWQQLREQSSDSELSEDLVWEAYSENLEIVFSSIAPLIENISGITVITADHGNLIGERLQPIPTKKKYGHYYGVYAPELVKVPWFIIESDQRREVTSGCPVENESTPDRVIERRLESLGYK